MIKMLRFPIIFVLSLCIFKNAFAQFPYVESFRNATSQGIIFGGSPSAFLTAGGSGYNVATSSHTGTPLDANGNGYLRLTSNVQNQKGYVINTTNFPSANGLTVTFEYYIYGGTGADGISLFLFDANANPFVIGGFGGSLGYAQITTTTPVSPGVSNGYLAIGLDEYGNFSNPTEGRQGGVGFKPGSVTLRGKGNGAALTSGNYSYLTTAEVEKFGFTLVGDGGQRQPDSTNAGYRRVYMDLAPQPAGGYNITVKVTRGGAKPITTTVIENYYYAEAAPDNLRYGFASSTGDQTNFHEIRQVHIDAHDQFGLTNPLAKNDALTLCQGNQALVDVTANDTTTNTGAVLNKSTIDLDPNQNGIQTTYTVSGKGTFSVNSQGSVQFIPEQNLSGTVSAAYTVKDSYGRTSNPATISLTYVTAPNQPDAGTDQLINISTPTTTYVLQGNSAGTNSGLWTQSSGPTGTSLLNAQQPNTTINNLTGGIYIFKWTLTSPGGCQRSDEVQLIVNHIPVAINDTITTSRDTNIPISVLGNDTDADGNYTINPSTIIIKSQPMHGTLVVDPVSGIVNYRPAANYSGYDSFVYTVKDNYGAESNTAIVNIAVNIKPVGVADMANTTTDLPVTIHVMDNDPGKAGSIVIKKTDPLKGTVVLNTDGTFTYSPNAGFSGKDSFTYSIQNKEGLQSDPITVTINVKPSGNPDVAATVAGNLVTIPVKENDPAKTGTTISLQLPPSNGNVGFDASGTPVYTPNPGFSGKDTFTYTLKTADGLSSDPISVTVSVKPLGSPDAYTTPFNQSVEIPVKDNDISKNGTTVVWVTPPAHGNISLNPTTGLPLYLPGTGFSGQDVFSYVLRTADGIDSDPITVTVTVRPAIVINAPDISVETPVNGPKVIDVPIPSGGKITITDPPKHGSITFDPITGQPIYTPNPGYSGPDEFTYIIVDKDGNPSTPGKVTIVVLIPGKIGLAKRLKSAPVRNQDGSYTLSYSFVLTNFGQIAIRDLTVTDDLFATFRGNTFEVQKISATGGLTANSSFNGSSNKNMLTGSNTLAKSASGTIDIEIRVSLDKYDGSFSNLATAEGFSVSDNSKTTDVSTDGTKPDPITAGDVSPSQPTVINLIREDLFIPGGFSPNNDGINDYFVVGNTNGKNINLDIFNRWGNLIYRSKSYQNDWNGKSTEGIHVGEEVPAGTYYYVLTIDGTDRRVGYITINR
ncbi:tandem-95 repeat protein [Pedobacter sp. KBS0701]|uniref:Ig-like domain-containing protein n=1 Tax=Pedobacter sp. KBS0701 TaxID=2578106 RepID=UPI00110DDC9E|nr:Ig-like domain-containing protein [Pedobacter sp. KBS0701]QDW26968.1 tandem-95 repeat protein [Pedobacter sp. KBS0701]